MDIFTKHKGFIYLFLFLGISVIPIQSDAALLDDDLVDLPDTVIVQVSDCADLAPICLGIPTDQIFEFQITDNGSSYGNGISGCDLDTIHFYTYSNLFGQGNSGPYILQSWMIDGVNYTTNFDSIPQLVDSLNSWDPLGNWELDAPNLLISGGVAGSDYTDMVIWVVQTGTNNILGHNIQLFPNGTEILLSAGDHELIVTESSSGLRDTTFIRVACIQTAVIQSTLFVSESDSTCLDFSDLPDEFGFIFNIGPDPAGIIGIDLQPGGITNTCVSWEGLMPGVDTVLFVACDQSFFCDTSMLIVNVLSPSSNQTITEFIEEGAAASYCIDTTGLMGTVDSFFICGQSPGNFATLSLDPSTWCIDYTGLVAGGRDTLCVELCNDIGVCDTTTLIVDVIPPGEDQLFDTLFINQAGQICNFNFTALHTGLDTLFNACPSSSGALVDFQVFPQLGCVDYFGMGIGTERACIVGIDSLGNTDTVNLFVTIVPPNLDIIIDQIRQDLRTTYCLDTIELGGVVLDSIFLCDPADNGTFSFNLDPATFCIDIETLQPGTDTLCVFICDDLNVCDTTLIIIEVPGDLTPPIANNDQNSTDLNSSITIDLLGNDSIPQGELTNFFILPIVDGGAGPNNGVAILNLDNTIQYIPDVDFCGADSLTYVICNSIGCDTALAIINIDCPITSDTIQIFTGFSPNQDDINDTWVIRGLENFPDHELCVFNRWGLRVLQTRNYQSDWRGEWESTELPSGSYYYILDDGVGNQFTGWVQIHR